MGQILDTVKSSANARLRSLIGSGARRKLQRKAELWRLLADYLEKTRSTGCPYSDYWELYQAVRARKPREILECGTGTSTLVMAFALCENEREGCPGRITSMEELDEYYRMARGLLPVSLQPYVELVHSPTVEDCYSLFRGVRYRDVPSRPYDFVFVDGPKPTAPSDGMTTFDYDFLHVLKHSDHEVYGLVDKRVSTCYVLQKVLGVDKVRYDSLLHLGFVGPCTRRDLKTIGTPPSSSFTGATRVFGNAELRMRLVPHAETPDR